MMSLIYLIVPVTRNGVHRSPGLVEVSEHIDEQVGYKHSRA